MRYLAWGIQILILTAGIHLFLRFVRTTRGNPLIRGLFLSVLVGVVGLWGLSTALRLEELQHILEGSTGFIVVGLAIIFHPELRRGIAQLGERPFARRSTDHSVDSAKRVVEAAHNMAARRDGALIAIERETSLKTIAETGSSIGARVSARLLESVFHPGGALHDGAVVVSQNRVVAAGCILPLSKENELDLSKGTRHRAALGLTEETDAVVVVVSEETGSISLAREGKLTSDIAPDRLEADLRDYLQSNGGSVGGSTAGFLTVLADVVRKDFVWIAGSMLLAWGAWYTAHQSIRQEKSFRVQIVDRAAVGRRTPRDGEILILPPESNMRVHTLSENDRFRVLVSGSQGEFDELDGDLRGIYEIDDVAWEGGPLDLAQVRWEESVVGLDYRWSTASPPELVVERSGTRRIQLEPDDLTVDTQRVDARFVARLEDARFEPGPNIEVTGPATLMADLGTTIPISLETITLEPDDKGYVTARLQLSAGLREENVVLLSDTVRVVIPVLPVERNAGTIRRDIALVCLSPARSHLLDEWALPANAQTARLAIVTSGLIPANADLGSPALVERKAPSPGSSRRTCACTSTWPSSRLPRRGARYQFT